MHRAFRCPYFVTTVVVGVSAVAIALYWYWSPKKKLCCKDLQKMDATMSNSSSSTISANASTSSDGEPRNQGGKDSETDVEEHSMFKFDDENVRKVCEKLFLEQMDLGESFLEDEETAERGAMHLSNAIALTGETDQLLKVLKKSVTASNYARIQKYIPSADMRINQLLQDELAADTIHEHFGLDV